MIYLLTGENTFQRDARVKQLIRELDSEVLGVERFDAADLELDRLRDVLMGQSLFSTNRLIIIDDASKAKSIWSSLKDLLAESSQDTNLILVDAAPDKRTATYKWLQKNAQVIDSPWWKVSESMRAEKWLTEYANQYKLELPRGIVRDMVTRATSNADDGKPIIDQQQLSNAVKQLQYIDGDIATADLDAVLAPGAHENIFELLSAALRCDTATVHTMINNLQQTEDGHRAMGLLISQVSGLAAMTLADESMPVEQVAKDIGAHPFALKQLARYARQRSSKDVGQIIEELAEADLRLKRSQAEPWLLIKTALTAISQR